jgi:membrane protease YdiL (CAAX protease family)
MMMMIDRNSKNFSYFAQFGILMGLIGAGMIVGTILSAFVWLTITNRPILLMGTDLLKPEYYNVTMLIQVISTFFLFFVPVYFFAVICYRKPLKFLGINSNINLKQVLLMIGILLLTFPLSGALAELNKVIPIPTTWAAKFKLMEDSRSAQEAALININSLPKYLISLIVIGLLPGLFEEIVFRAGIQNLLTRWFKGPAIAIIITAIVFSLVHISYYGFLVRFALGVILGLIFYLSDNIWLSAMFHFLYNGLQVTALYLYTSAGSKDQKDIEENFPIWAGIVAFILIIYLFVEFRKTSLIQKAKIPDDYPPDDFYTWTT